MIDLVYHLEALTIGAVSFISSYATNNWRLSRLEKDVIDNKLDFKEDTNDLKGEFEEHIKDFSNQKIAYERRFAEHDSRLMSIHLKFESIMDILREIKIDLKELKK